MRTTASRFAPARTPKSIQGRHPVPWALSTTRGEAGGPFPRGLEQGQGGHWVPGGASPRRGQAARGRNAVGGRRRRRLSCATASGVSAASCGLRARGAGAAAGAGPPGPQSAAALPPATAQRCGKTSGRVLGGQAGGRHARGARGAGCREERGWWGGARAHAPCARAILE